MRVTKIWGSKQYKKSLDEIFFSEIFHMIEKLEKKHQRERRQNFWNKTKKKKKRCLCKERDRKWTRHKLP